VGSVKSVVEVVEVVVHLHGGELTLVDDVGGGEGADVEAGLEAARRQRRLSDKRVTYIL